MRSELRVHWRRSLRDLGLLVTIALIGVASGATAVLFGAVDALVLRPIKTPHLDRVVTMGGLSFGDGMPSPIEWWGQAEALEAIAMFDAGDVLLESDAGSRWVRTAAITDRFFSVLPQQAAAGQVHSLRDNQILISENLWHSFLGGSPSRIGSAVRLNNVSFEIAGVVSAGFEYPGGASVWLAADPRGSSPLSYVTGGTELPQMRRNAGFIGRIKAGHTTGELQQQLTALLEQANRELSPRTGVAYGDTVGVRPISETMSRDFASTLRTMLFASVFVLLVTTLNLGSAIATRLLQRMQELDVRRWLGASTPQLAQLHLGWIAILLCASAVTSVVAARLLLSGADYALPLLSIHLPRSGALSATVFAGAVGIAVILVTIAAGVGWVVAGVSRGQQHGSHGYIFRRLAPWPRRALTVLQVAFTFMLVVGSVVTVRELAATTIADFGYDPDNVVATQVSFTTTNASSQDVADWRSQLLVAGEQVSNVSEVAITSILPAYFRDKRGVQVLVDANRVMATVIDASPAYFEVLGITMAAGRPFASNRNDEAVINEAFAIAAFGTREALGRRITVSGADQPLEVVGVIPTLRTADRPDERTPELLRAFRTVAVDTRKVAPSLYMIAKCRLECRDVGPALLKSVRVIPGTSIRRVDDLRQLTRAATAPTRGRAVVWISYASLGVLIALMAIAAMVAHAVATRRFEAHVRIALGAEPRSVLMLMASEGIQSAAAGLVLGVGLSMLSITFVQKTIVNLEAPSAILLAATAVTFLVVASLAAFAPAIEATHFNARTLLKDVR
jgi:predicted permease